MKAEKEIIGRLDNYASSVEMDLKWMSNDAFEYLEEISLSDYKAKFQFLDEVIEIPIAIKDSGEDTLFSDYFGNEYFPDVYHTDLGILLLKESEITNQIKLYGWELLRFIDRENHLDKENFDFDDVLCVGGICIDALTRPFFRKHDLGECILRKCIATDSYDYFGEDEDKWTLADIKKFKEKWK